MSMQNFLSNVSKKIFAFFDEFCQAREVVNNRKGVSRYARPSSMRTRTEPLRVFAHAGDDP